MTNQNSKPLEESQAHTISQEELQQLKVQNSRFKVIAFICGSLGLVAVGALVSLFLVNRDMADPTIQPEAQPVSSPMTATQPQATGQTETVSSASPAVHAQNKPSTDEATGRPNQNRYTSYRLGISFLYQPDQNGVKVKVKEEGSKVYVYMVSSPSLSHTDGQFVEVFEKKSSETVAEAVKRLFLTGKDPVQCFVEAKPAPVNAEYTKAEITYPQDESDDMESMWQKTLICSEHYAKTNGIRYFLGQDSGTSLVFFSIGQYGIASDETTMWQDSVEFL